MRLNVLKSLILLPAVCLVMSYDVPKGWHKSGSEPEKYDMGTDLKAGRNNNNAATIKSVDPATNGFGTLMQTFAPESYAGKRIRLTAYVKAKDVQGWSGVWLRVDGKKKEKSLSFDNMYDRPIKGTQDWTKCELVLDVPKNATNIAYGALLSGAGQIWFDGINFEVVPETVPTTGRNSEKKEESGPRNLNFE